MLKYTIVLWTLGIYYGNTPGGCINSNLVANSTHYKGFYWSIHDSYPDGAMYYSIGWSSVYAESREIRLLDLSGEVFFEISNLNYPGELQEFTVPFTWNYYDEDYYPLFLIDGEPVNITGYEYNEVNVSKSQPFAFSFLGFTFPHDQINFFEHFGYLSFDGLSPEEPDIEDYYFTGDYFTTVILNKEGSYQAHWRFIPDVTGEMRADLIFNVVDTETDGNVSITNFPDIPQYMGSVWVIFALGVGASIFYLLGKSARR